MASDVSLNTSNATYLSGAIRWTGLGSGVDFDEVVAQLVAIEETNMRRLEYWKTEWEDKITSLEGLNSRMAALEDFTDSFRAYDDFYSRTAATSNSSVVTVTNTNTATTGSHTITVGSDIPGSIATRSYEDGVALGGEAGSIVIYVGDPDDASTWQTVTLDEGVDWEFDNASHDIDHLAAQIDAVDDAGDDILQSVRVVEDKTRTLPAAAAGSYKRLIITGKDGGADYQVWVAQPSGMDLFYEDATNLTSIDEPFYEENWISDAELTKSGTYTGSTNKTFTFMVQTTGHIGSDDIGIRWADDEGNTGTITVTDYGTYEVFQGVELTIADGGVDMLYASDSFTMDAYHTNFQVAADKGLATVEQRVHSGFADMTTAVTTADATFTYYYEGVATTIDVSTNDTLGDLRDLINDDPDNRGVRATIINDGLSTSTSYHLVLTGLSTGAEHTISQISGTLTNFDCTDSEFATTQKASNSMIKVDGYPATSYDYIQRASNTISDVLSDITLSLVDSGSAVITVGDNKSAVKSNIELFVSSINFVVDYIREETKYIPDTGEAGVMLGNYSYTLVSSVMNQMLYPTGLDDEVDTYTTLADIGITSDPDQDGKWVINESLLSSVLDTDIEAVARIFVEDEDHGSEGVCQRLYDKMTEFTDSETGIANVLISNYNGIINGIDDKIVQEERRVANYEQRLVERFARLESVLGELSNEQEYLEQQLDSLPTVSSK